METLYQRSLQFLMQNQSPEGAFIACPNFDNYRYAWFRDGSFCAQALLIAGKIDESARFHEWASQVVLRYRAKIKKCIEDVRLGQPLTAVACFHSRFTLDGYEVPGNWGHHQLDGLGTWLWALAEYRRACPEQDLPGDWLEAAALVRDYLINLWRLPCSDCWEENETRVHTYTLAAIYGGLSEYARAFSDAQVGESAQEIRRWILQKCVRNGLFVKSVGSQNVDASLLGLYYPYGVVSWDDPIYQKTLAQIRLELSTPVGLHRYRSDTYYGSGEWILLTAWLGWVHARSGDFSTARSIADWIEEQADEQGHLAEQIPHGLYNSQAYLYWLKKWGPVATPLLWSHAQYVLLVDAIQNPGSTTPKGA